MSPKLKGPMAALLTPRSSDGAADLDAFAASVDFVLSRGATGVVVAGDDYVLRINLIGDCSRNIDEVPSVKGNSDAGAGCLMETHTCRKSLADDISPVSRNAKKGSLFSSTGQKPFAAIGIDPLKSIEFAFNSKYWNNQTAFVLLDSWRRRNTFSF